MSSGRTRTRSDQARGVDNWLAATLVLGSVMNPINTTTVAVALIPIGLALDVPPSETVWLVSAMYLATAIGQPMAGRLVDIVGARRTYLAATVVIGIGGMVGTLAPTLWVLVAARVLLGLGTSAAYPAAISVIRSDVGSSGIDRQTGLLTVLSVSNQALAAIGPVLGGILLEGSWRALFAINVPLALLCFGLGAWRLPSAKNRRSRGSVRDLDLPGVVLFVVALCTLMLCLLEPATLLTYALPVAIAAGAAMIVVEWRKDDPFIDVRMIMHNRPLTTTFLRQALSLSVSFCYVYGFTQWLADVRGFSATATGLMVAPLFVVSVIVSAVLVRSRALRARLASGAIAAMAGCTILITLHDDSPVAAMLSATILLGIAQGLNGPALQMSVFLQSERSRIGTSAGLLRTSGYLGAMVSSGAVAACFPNAATLSGLHRLSWYMLAACTTLLVVSLVDPTLRRTRVAADFAAM